MNMKTFILFENMNSKYANMKKTFKVDIKCV